MNTATLEPSTADQCPLRHGAAAALQPQQRLLLPHGRRMVVQYADGEQGRELRLYHGTHEVCFDDPATFAFGETLARQHLFVAADAVAWGPGYDWPRVQGWLDDLVAAGVLRPLADDEPAPALRPLAQELSVPSPLPPATCVRPRSWHDSASLFQELTGRALDPAWLELVVPVFRVAHMALDADGRQVGEANVFPPALRLDVPTRWRTCIYDGTRHLADKPMNVTALKAMRQHWPQMMALLRRCRAAYLARYPDAAAGWTVGHVERLATGVLALPTLALLRSPPPGAPLHPVLSSLFRVTDGVRMVMHQMLFVPVGEPARHPDDPVDAAEVHAYAERNYAFHSDHGVCAGPRAMVDEFLGVLLDDRAPRDGWAGTLDPALAEVADTIDDALAYGLHGLRAYAVTFSLWPQMVRGYEALAAAAAAIDAGASPAAGTLHRRLQDHLRTVQETSYLSTEERRTHRDRVYADMLAQCERGLGLAPGAPLAARLQPRADAGDAAAAGALRQALVQRLGAAVDVQPLLAVVMDALQRLRALLAEATQVQAALNAHVRRGPPQQPLQAADLDLHNQLLGAARRRLPFLLDELQSILDCEIRVTADRIAVTSPIGRHVAGRHPAHPVRTL